jgi:hypothetical protein
MEVAVAKTADVAHFADVIMAMIREDQDSGQVPKEAFSWDELDESVDIADYFRQAGLASATEDAVVLRAAVSEEVGLRLAAAQSGPWRVLWRQPGRSEANIGRLIGYPTRADAEKVGSDYVAAHGGSFHVMGG